MPLLLFPYDIVYLHTFTEATGLTDPQTLLQSIVKTESIGGQDVITRVRERDKFGESFGLVDSMELSRTIVVTDALGLTDPRSIGSTPGGGGVNDGTAEDAVGLSDALALAQYITITDNLSVIAYDPELVHDTTNPHIVAAMNKRPNRAPRSVNMGTIVGHRRLIYVNRRSARPGRANDR